SVLPWRTLAGAKIRGCPAPCARALGPEHGMGGGPSLGAVGSIPHDGASTAETASTGDSTVREQDVVEQRVRPCFQRLSLTGSGTGWPAALHKVTSAAPIHGY